MAPATRKSKRAAAAAAVTKQEEAALLEEPEEKAPKRKKEDPDTTPAKTEHSNIAQTEQEQSPCETADAFVESQPHSQGTDAEENPQAGEDATVIEVENPQAGDDVTAIEVDNPQAGDDATAIEVENPQAGEDVTVIEVEEEAEEQIAVEIVAEGEGGEEEEGDEKEVEEAEEVEEDGERIGLDVEGGASDNRLGDDNHVEEIGGADEKQEEEAAEKNGSSSAADGLSKNATSASREDEAFPSQGKIFIGGLTWETTADTLQNHFGKYGEITDSVVMKNRNTGHPRGFGFVTFADPSVCNKVLKDTHIIDGRTVEAKQTVPREASGKGPKSKKIFVGGLTTTTTEVELKAYFEKFGKVVEHQIMQDHKTGRSRGFGFVTFDSEEVVDNILAQGRLLELGGKQVEIKRAEPKRAGQESSAGSSSSARPFTGRGGGFRGGYGAYDPYLTRGGGLNIRGGGGGRPGGYPSGDAYRYGGGYSGPYGYGALDDSYIGLGLNHPTFDSGPGYGYNFNGSYGGSARGYGGNNVRYHPYGR